MPRGNNLVILRGRLGTDPEHHVLPSGDVVAKLRLATSHYWKNKAGEKQEHTDWHNVDLMGQQSAFCLRLLRKGDLVQVLGSIRYAVREKDGRSRTFTAVKAWEISLLTPLGDRKERQLPGGGLAGMGGAAQQTPNISSDALPF